MGFVRKTKTRLNTQLQKPVDLCVYLIETYPILVIPSLTPSWVLAPPVACVQTGRNFHRCEIDEGYFNIAKRRIEDAQQQMILPMEME
jgi:site-specific DNA-methyltransferase (adenine-specific)